MIFKVVILFFVSAVCCQNLSEGERCYKDGAEGVCLNLRQCRIAQAEIAQNKRPKICSFDRTDNFAPIVCCLEKTSKGPVIDDNKCDPLPTRISPLKTGRKAFDKCIEYQQKYVYPCGRGTALVGSYSREINCHHKTDSLILGGEDASRYEFPHMALLGYGDLNTVEWECGGSIISERFVLTAGHCTYRAANDPVTYVAIGALRLADTKDQSKVYKVKNMFKHPQYQSPAVYNDIALIETEKPMELSEFIVPLCLHIGDFVNDTQVLATGWGNTQGDGRHKSEVLQKVILSKFPAKNCSKIYRSKRRMKRGYDSLTMMCYGDAAAPQLYNNRFKLENKDTCEGDSGGPIQIKDQKIHCMYTAVGVVSIGKPKCGHKPAIYTKVAPYLTWIEDIVWPN